MANRNERPDVPQAGGDQTWSGDPFSGAPESHPAPAARESTRKSEPKGEDLVPGERSMMGDGQYQDSSTGIEGRNPEGSAGLGADTYDEET